MADVSLDEIIRRKNNKNFHVNNSSLDDIIKKRNIRTLPKTNMRPQLKSRLTQSVHADLGIEPEPQVMDARNKIIQNKRGRLVDARDRLAEIAKQGDARDKINKMRKQTNVLKKKPIEWKKNTVPLQKKIHNENRQSNLGGKTQMQGKSLVRTVAGDPTPAKMGANYGQYGSVPAKKPLLKAPPLTQSQPPSRYHPIRNNPHVVTIKNEKAEFRNAQNRAMESYRSRPARPQPMKPPANGHPVQRSVPQPLFPPNYYMGGGMRSDMMGRGRSPEPAYRPRRSPQQEEIRPMRLKITTANNYKHQEASMPYDEWDTPPRMPPTRMPPARMPPSRMLEEDMMVERLPPARIPAKKRPMYEEEMEVARPKKLGPISQGLMARLDQQPQRPSVPEGFKVMVTNLHPNVSVEDMEELFGTIGPILSTRMIKDGMAETIFVNEEDAYKSVEVFHKRQLDGQPMCVTVVNKKAAPPAPFAPPSRLETKSVLKAASGGSNMRPGLPSVMGPRSEEQVLPNISAIHQALFNRSQPPSSNQMFLVKLPKQPARKEVT